MIQSPSLSLPAALAALPSSWFRTSGRSQAEDEVRTLFEARSVSLLVQHAKQVLFTPVEQPLPFLFLLILGTKDFESFPTEVKSI